MFAFANRFRARGPSIHRKMDLSQVPRGPIGTKDDPLADPYDDPSYGFGFRTSEYQRREDGDGVGRVRGNFIILERGAGLTMLQVLVKIMIRLIRTTMLIGLPLG